jgi:hypothetical protein
MQKTFREARQCDTPNTLQLNNLYLRGAFPRGVAPPFTRKYPQLDDAFDAEFGKSGIQEIRNIRRTRNQPRCSGRLEETANERESKKSTHRPREEFQINQTLRRDKIRSDSARFGALLLNSIEEFKSNA